MAEALNDLKKDYRARFCHGGGKKIDLRQGQNLVKFIQDCFENYSNDLKINSPSCSTSILKNEERTSMQSQRPKPESASSVKRTSKSPDLSPVSPQEPVSSRGQACKSHVKSATDNYVAAAEKTESSASKSEEKSTIKDVEAGCQCQDVHLGSEDNRGSARSPFLLEEAKSSPVVKLCFDNWSMPAAAEGHGEVKNFEGPQPGRDEQVLPVQGTERVTSSARTEKPFASAVLAAVATRTLGQRYSTSVSPPSPCSVKHQDIEVEDECDFLIDESSDASSASWISIPTKNKKSKSDGSAAPISKPQPCEKEKTQYKKVKNRKVQVKALSKQKLDHLDVGTFDLKEVSESDPIPNKEENVLTSQSRKGTHTGKTKKDALRQDSPNQKKNTSWRPQAEKLMSSWSGLETKPSDEERCKTRMLPSEDLPMPSSGHQEQHTTSLKRSLRSSKNLQLTSETSQDLVKKKQTAEQKLPEVEVAKRETVPPKKKPKKSVQPSSSKKPHLRREQRSDSESDEEELEREGTELNEVCTTPLDQKLKTPVMQKLTKSSVKKKQTAAQKLPEVEVAERETVPPRGKPRKSVQPSSSKMAYLRRRERSDSESDEEELEREGTELNEVCTTPLDQKLKTPVMQKLTKSSVKKKQTAEQKLPEVEVAKRETVPPRGKPRKSVQPSSSKMAYLRRWERSDSESDEEELEREGTELNEVCTTPLDQKLKTPVIQKLTKSKKPRNVLHTSESSDDANNRASPKALQHPMEGVKNPAKKRLSAESSGKIPYKIPRRTNKALSSSSEDTESQTDSDSSSVQDMARKKPKLPDVKIKSNKRKQDRQHGPQHSFVAAKILNCESGPVLEDSDLFTTGSESSEQDDTFSDSSEELNYKLRRLLSDEIARQKIVMPSNTPNVRRTKRIRLRPLEYWRGERVNYTMDPSGTLVVSGIVHPETESLRKSKERRKDRPKEKTDTTNGREIPASFDHCLADVSKPTIVRDPLTNKEVLLDCISTANSCSCHRNDEAAEIYKNLSTSHFATGILILKPLKVKGRQFVYTSTIAFHIIRGEAIVTIHKTSYYLATGDSFYVPAGNEYDICNLLNAPSLFLFTQLKER